MRRLTAASLVLIGGATVAICTGLLLCTYPPTAASPLNPGVLPWWIAGGAVLALALVAVRPGE